MTKEIKVGARTIPFTANGATPLFYKQFFKNDLLKLISVKGNDITIGTENVPELAFIMAKQADGANFMQLTMDHYIEFLSRFEPMDITLAGDEIMRLYLGDLATDVQPKKKTKGVAKGK